MMDVNVTNAGKTVLRFSLDHRKDEKTVSRRLSRRESHIERRRLEKAREAQEK